MPAGLIAMVSWPAVAGGTELRRVAGTGPAMTGNQAGAWPDVRAWATSLLMLPNCTSSAKTGGQLGA